MLSLVLKHPHPPKIPVTHQDFLNYFSANLEFPTKKHDSIASIASIVGWDVGVNLHPRDRPSHTCWRQSFLQRKGTPCFFYGATFLLTQKNTKDHALFSGEIPQKYTLYIKFDKIPKIGNLMNLFAVSKKTTWHPVQKLPNEGLQHQQDALQVI